MADMAKVSSARIPRKGLDTADPRGDGVARGIGPRGVNMTGGMHSMEDYSHTPGEGIGSRNPFGIGSGDGGDTIDEMGPGNPGHAL